MTPKASSPRRPPQRVRPGGSRIGRGLAVGAVLGLALTGCKRELAPEPPDDWHYELDEALGATVQAAARGSEGRTWVALADLADPASPDAAFAVRDGDEGGFTFAARGDLPPGPITFLGAIDGSREWLIAHVHGKGTFRSWAGSGVWDALNLRSPLLEVLKPGSRPVPTDMAITPEGVVWLATLGGLYFSSDEGATFAPADTSSSGSSNLVFTGVAAQGERVIAVAALPESLIPSQFDGILGGRVFVSETSGLTWSTADDGFPSNHPTSVAFSDDGTIHVGTMDDGVVRGSAGAWTPLFGPTDVRDLTWARGGLDVASATRGVWRLEDEVWSQAGVGAGHTVLGSSAVTRGGEVFTLAKGTAEAAGPPKNGTVHVALSFHVNYYHSYRGDANTEDGFGRDIRIIRTIQDWLEDHPRVRADWDLENAFTTDDWMPAYSPDVLQRIQARVADGRDDVRLMSWNNGAMASSTRTEFEVSIQKAWESNTDLFSRVVPGVQPQENMLSPDHLAWYAEEGVDWVTLFYSANGFTGPRNDIRLDGASAYNPVSLRDGQSNASLTMVPVYHHADLLDHGGLQGWVRQLNAQFDEDTLLVIHFDADGDSWERFDLELESIADLPFVEYTTIASYLGNHPPAGDVVLPGDVADGVGDGFSSWGEKSVNHEIWTRIEASRRLTNAAALIGQGHIPTQDAVQLTVEPRLLALSTTHFGLATPALHPDREVSARAYANDAVYAAENAFALADAHRPLQPFELEVVNPRPSAGISLIPFQIRMPTGVWEGDEGLVVDRSDTPQLVRAFLARTEGAEDVIDVFMRMETPGTGRTPLTWQYDPGDPADITGSLTVADVPTLPVLGPPMAECNGVAQLATGGPVSSNVDARGLRAARVEEWRLPTCSGLSDVTRTLSRFDGFPGVLVQVQAVIDNPDDVDDLTSLALTPLKCPGGVSSLRWPTFGGNVRTREVPRGIETWNPVAADGWFEATCGSGLGIQVAVDTSLRSSMGLLSLRNDGPDGLLAPMGTLYGDGRHHDAGRTGGIGLSDQITPVVGSQFTPSAPSWGGQEVAYRMWIAADLDEATLDLLAHPPLVRVRYAAP